jgi:hypothetical protein
MICFLLSMIVTAYACEVSLRKISQSIAHGFDHLAIGFLEADLILSRRSRNGYRTADQIATAPGYFKMLRRLVFRQGFDIRICHIVGIRRATMSNLGSPRKI